MEKIQLVLAIVGGVLIGLPAFLRGLLVICKAIPGDQPDAIIEKILSISEKIADVISKLYPSAPKPAEPKA